MNIGMTISNLRRNKGLTQIEFANLIGITQTSLSQIESGKKKPGTSNLKKICDTLGISELHLYLLSFDESDVPESKRELYRQIQAPLKNLVSSLVD
jgi:transcriptional regulator with XRE-family HTH domain